MVSRILEIQLTYWCKKKCYFEQREERKKNRNFEKRTEMMIDLKSVLKKQEIRGNWV